MSFTFNGATIAARELTIADEEHISNIAQRLTGGSGGWTGIQYAFAEFMAAADVTGEPPLTMVTADDPPQVLQASFAAWGKLPRRFLRSWRAELTAAEIPNESAAQT